MDHTSYLRKERLKKEYCSRCMHYREYREHGVPCLKDVLGYVSYERPCRKIKLVPKYMRDAIEKINADDNLSPYDKLMAGVRVEATPLFTWFKSIFA